MRLNFTNHGIRNENCNGVILHANFVVKLSVHAYYTCLTRCFSYWVSLCDIFHKIVVPFALHSPTDRYCFSKPVYIYSW